MVHHGSERRCPGYQYSGWALGQSREARGTFLIQNPLLGTSLAIRVGRTCHHPFRGHSQIAPTRTSDTLTSRNRKNGPILLPVSSAESSFVRQIVRLTRFQSCTTYIKHGVLWQQNPLPSPVTLLRATLRANISETLPVVVINEQGEEEKNKDEQEFSWCCLRGRGWRGTKRRRA